jgi:hypothetical protein
MITWKRSAIFFFVLLVFTCVTAVFWSREKSDVRCESSTVGEQWSSDRVYKATLLRKSCNFGETVFYSFRLDFTGSKTSSGWFISGFDLEIDEYPQADPEIIWVNSRKVQVLIHTRTLNGTLSRNVGSDLIFVRPYIAKEPLAFPNY